MLPKRDFSGLASSIYALARAAAKEAIDPLYRCMTALLGVSVTAPEEVELTAPDFDRLARTPWPSLLASSGIMPLNSALACSWSRWADRVLAKDALMSTMRMASRPRFWRLDPE